MLAQDTDDVPEVLLKDLRANSEPVRLLARIVSLERREVTRRSDGQRRPLLSGLLSDGTATVRFTWWDPPAEGVERGTILRAANAIVREYRGKPEVTFTWKTQVGPASEIELPKIDPMGISRLQVSELAPSSEAFRVEGRILRVSPRTVHVGQEQKLLHDGLIADASGTASFSAWTDFGLVAGEAIRVSGAYVREFRGRPQLVLDERSSVDRIDGAALPTLELLQKVETRSVGAIEDAGGGEIVAAEGVAIAVLPPSGIVYRCPTCRRTVVKGLCRIHGVVEGVPDLRARIVLDDGTAAATLNLDRAATERLWGRTLEESLNRLRDQPDPSLLEEQLFDVVFGKRIRVRGRAHRDDFGLTIVPETVDLVAPDTSEAARTTRNRWGPGMP